MVDDAHLTAVTAIWETLADAGADSESHCLAKSSVTSATDRRVELRLTLQARNVTRDVAVETEPWAPLGDAFVQAGLPIESDSTVYCPRLCANLPTDTPVVNCGLRHGDILVLGGGAPSTSPQVPLNRTADIELVVVSGPSAGLRKGLAGKPLLVGRGEHCDVMLADRSASAEHFELRMEGGRVEVRDLGSTNGIAIEGRRLPAQTWVPLPAGCQVEAGRSLIEVEGAGGTRITADPALGEVVANRPPRRRVRFKPASFELNAPPEPGHRARLPLIAATVPIVGGIALWLLLDSATMLIFTALSPMMAFGTWFSDRRASKRSEAGREGRWRGELKELEGNLVSSATVEAQARREAAPNAGTLVAWALRTKPELWERRRGDDDVLRLRVGSADLPSQAVVKVGRGGPPDLRAEAERRLAAHVTLPALPVTIDLDAAVAGVCGDPDAAAAISSWLLVQTAILHSPVDVIICAAVPRGSRWDWVGWLPHAYGARSPWGGPLVARDATSTAVLLRGLLDLQTQRQADRSGHVGADSASVRIVLLVDQRVEPRRDVIESICALAADTSVSVVYLGDVRSDLPGTSRWVLEAASERATLAVTDAVASTTIADVSIESLSHEICDQVARALAPVRDGGAASGSSGEIPDSAALLEILALREVTSATILERWRKAPRTLGAPVGIGPEGPVDLDLLVHGPHALVVGTTGSGKSEFLKALVAGLITTHPVEHLTLLLLDFKGGAAFLPFRDVPHVVGLASELDAQAARRALLSLRAESERRQRLFNDAGVPDLRAMRRDKPDAAPPYLLVAVDEFGFAEEAAPGFIDGMVAIAKKGRSQGIHLLLANQQLDSTFAPGILKNTNLRVSLRVLTDDESDTVVGTKAAARIPEGRKGRGFWRQAGGPAVEFQGSYVSGHTRLGAAAPVVVRPLCDGWIDRDIEADGDHPRGATDFEALRSAITEAHRESGAVTPTPLWQPPLPELLALESLDASTGARNATVPIGIVDDPAARRRDPLALDLAVAGNVLILGPGGAGRTTALRTIAAALALSRGPETFHLYGIDDGSRQLGSIAALPNCGDVVAVHDRERLELLLRRLVGISEQRATLLAGTGAVSVSDLPPEDRPPRVVLLLDGMAQFSEATSVALLPHGELLGRIVSGGRQAGVHVVLTADRRSAVPPALHPHIGLRILLRPTADELQLSGVRGGVDASDAPAGRGILEDGRMCQLAVVGTDPARQAEALGALSPPDPDGLSRPPAVRALPAVVERRTLAPAAGVRIPIGICAPDLDPAYVNLANRHLLVLGALHSGRTTALTTLADGLHRAGELETYLLTPRRSPLTALTDWTDTAQADAIIALVDSLTDRARDNAEVPWAVVFVDDGHELQQPKVQDALARMTQLGREGGVRIVAATDLAGARIGAQWLRGVRGDSHALLLMPQSKDEGAVVGADIPVRPSAPWVPGRGWLAVGGLIQLVQTAK